MERLSHFLQASISSSKYPSKLLNFGNANNVRFHRIQFLQVPNFFIEKEFFGWSAALLGTSLFYCWSPAGGWSDVSLTFHKIKCHNFLNEFKIFAFINFKMTVIICIWLKKLLHWKNKKQFCIFYFYFFLISVYLTFYFLKIIVCTLRALFFFYI